MEETLDLVKSLKERFEVKTVLPYGKVILVPSRLFEPAWEATLESQGHRVFVNAKGGEPFCFVAVRKSKPRHIDRSRVSSSQKRSVPPNIPHTGLLQMKTRSEKKRSSSIERVPLGKLVMIPIELIKHSTTNPREHFKEADLRAMAVTIERHGLLQPIVVKQAQKSYGYEVVIGERRLRACKLARFQTLPVIVVDELDEETLLEVQIVENLQRKDLTVYEQIKVVKALRKLGLTHKEIAVRCGMSHGKAGDLVYICEHLPEDYQRIIVSGRTRAHSQKAFTQQKALLVAKAGLPLDQLKNVVSLIVEEGITSSGLAKKLATKPKEKVKRVLSYSSKNYWLQLVKPLKDFARYWRDNCKLEEWEDEEKRYLRLEVWLNKDLSEEEN